LKLVGVDQNWNGADVDFKVIELVNEIRQSFFAGVYDYFSFVCEIDDDLL
jgi:hypothetical protein